MDNSTGTRSATRRGAPPRRWSIVLLAGLACIQYVSPPTEPLPAQRLAAAEALYRDARDLYFQSMIARALGTGRSDRGVPLAQLEGTFEALRERAVERLQELDESAYGAEDRRAIARMRSALGETLPGPDASASACPPIPGGTSGTRGVPLATLLAACQRRAASAVATPGDTVDQGTLLTRLATEPSAARRRELFLSLRPVWESVNATNTPASPWRTLLAERSPSNGSGPMQLLGVAPDQVEPVLRGILDAWRRATPDTLLEPWDWWYQHAAASRRLAPRIGVRDLERLNEEYFAAWGASPRTLGIRHDLDVRPGKGPFATTLFGGVPRRTREGPRGAEPWVIAAYRDGAFTNLVDLLHQTGHAVHLAAISGRPAFADWPDDAALSEALADLPALEAFEGTWQLRYLGDSATRKDNQAQRLAAVALDVAWALFEWRMDRQRSADPNQEWSEITGRYLHIRPHPEWSWWAMRASLADSAGATMHRVAGAVVATELRARVAERFGGFGRSDRTMYAKVSEALYRHGRARPARDLLVEFLGRAPSTARLLADIDALR